MDRTAIRVVFTRCCFRWMVLTHLKKKSLFMYYGIMTMLRFTGSGGVKGKKGGLYGYSAVNINLLMLLWK